MASLQFNNHALACPCILGQRGPIQIQWITIQLWIGRIFGTQTKKNNCYYPYFFSKHDLLLTGLMSSVPLFPPAPCIASQWCIDWLRCSTLCVSYESSDLLHIRIRFYTGYAFGLWSLSFDCPVPIGDPRNITAFRFITKLFYREKASLLPVWQ